LSKGVSIFLENTDEKLKQNYRSIYKIKNGDQKEKKEEEKI
jgi:hypothetical protein